MRCLVLLIVMLNATLAVAGPKKRKLLDGVHAAVVEVVKARKSQPVVVFDLDATLYDNRPRTLAILKEWARQPDEINTFAAQKVLGLRIDQVEYLVADTLKNLGITEAITIKRAVNFWLPRFFGDSAVLDWPMPGGPAFVAKLYDAGAHIVYLTGRDAPRMLEGTIRSLQLAGYPIGLVRTQLIMKPRSVDLDDTAFKGQVVKHLRQSGTVVALFDNESGNVNMMRTRFPDAKIIFLKTAFDPRKAEPLKPGIRTIKDFRR